VKDTARGAAPASVSGTSPTRVRHVSDRCRGRVGHGTRLAALAALAWAGLAAAQEPAAGDVAQKAQVCFACHGPNGASTTGKYPVIAGQQQYYLYLQLKDFKAGRRENAEMQPIVATLAPEDLMPLAEFFSQQRWPSLTFDLDSAKVAAGEASTNAGGCSGCHLGGYNGASSVPRLAGQQLEYLQKTMLDFRSKARNNQPAMSALMAAFNEEEIAGLAQYLASLTVPETSSATEVQ
jgi:cytochrome c553